MKQLSYILVITLCIGCGSVEWGNNIEFVNELDLNIDSLKFTVCDISTMLYNYEYNGEKYINDKPDFPKNGYPCNVEITVFSNGKAINLITDSFDCYHCDNAKYYLLKEDSAIFQTYYIDPNYQLDEEKIESDSAGLYPK